MKKRVLSLALALIMLVSLLSVSAFAEPRTERNIQGDFIQGTPFVSLKDSHIALPDVGSIQTFGEGIGSGPLTPRQQVPAILRCILP